MSSINLGKYYLGLVYSFLSHFNVFFIFFIALLVTYDDKIIFLIVYQLYNLLGRLFSERMH